MAFQRQHRVVERFEPARWVQGVISMDGVNLLSLGLDEVRGRIAAIPQDPVLFSGTVRSNLDPFDRHTDAELWEALRHVNLHVRLLARQYSQARAAVWVLSSVGCLFRHWQMHGALSDVILGRAGYCEWADRRPGGPCCGERRQLLGRPAAATLRGARLATPPQGEIAAVTGT